jgi:hypothetical protein
LLSIIPGGSRCQLEAFGHAGDSDVEAEAGGAARLEVAIGLIVRARHVSRTLGAIAIHCPLDDDIAEVFAWLRLS